MKRLLLFLVVSGVILAFSPAAHCGQPNDTLDVSINVVELCTVSTSALDFGDYNPRTGVTAEGSVDVTCPAGVSYKIALDAGQNSKPGRWRRMTDGDGHYLRYRIWKDSCRKR